MTITLSTGTHHTKDLCIVINYQINPVSTVYHITRFFTGSYFRVLAFILVGEVIFVEEKFTYRLSIKKLTVPHHVRLCLARDYRVHKQLQKQACVLNTQCVDVAQKYCFPFHP